MGYPDFYKHDYRHDFLASDAEAPSACIGKYLFYPLQLLFCPMSAAQYNPKDCLAAHCKQIASS